MRKTAGDRVVAALGAMGGGVGWVSEPLADVARRARLSQAVAGQTLLELVAAGTVALQRTDAGTGYRLCPCLADEPTMSDWLGPIPGAEGQADLPGLGVPAPADPGPKGPMPADWRLTFKMKRISTRHGMGEATATLEFEACHAHHASRTQSRFTGRGWESGVWTTWVLKWRRDQDRRTSATLPPGDPAALAYLNEGIVIAGQPR